MSLSSINIIEHLLNGELKLINRHEFMRPIKAHDKHKFKITIDRQLASCLVSTLISSEAYREAYISNLGKLEGQLCLNFVLVSIYKDNIDYNWLESNFIIY